MSNHILAKVDGCRAHYAELLQKVDQQGKTIHNYIEPYQIHRFIPNMSQLGKVFIFQDLCVCWFFWTRNFEPWARINHFLTVKWA